MTSPILVTREDDVVIIALNKPEKLNAMDLPMWQGLGEAFAQVNDDESVRCVILKGEGGKAFAAGADIKEFDTVRATAAQAKDYDLVMRRALDGVRLCPHPVVVQIDGACVGGGLELACMADIRICGEGSRFGVPINRISVVMAHPEIQGLLRHANPAHVLEILLEGKIVGAADAFRMGLVNRVVEDDMVSEEVIATVRRITAGAPLVNRWHKAFVRRLSSDPSPLTAEEMDRAYDFLATSDYKEGIAAFTAKRKPAFSGT
jgi:enoyl-CoA hydratase/carnithine racemase